MASKQGIQAAEAFVKFSADLSSLPGDFQDAESQFKAFKDRVNKRDSLSSVRADLDTKAAEGKLSGLQKSVRDALDPKGAPLLKNVSKDLDARIGILEPRIRRLFELPTAKEAEIRKRADAQIKSLADSEIGSLKAANDRVSAAERNLASAKTIGGPAGKEAKKLAQDELADAKKLLKARETGVVEREQRIKAAAQREIDAYTERQAKIRKKYQQEYEDLVKQRSVIEKELKKLDKAREGKATTNRKAVDTLQKQRVSEQEKEAKRLQAESKAQAKALSDAKAKQAEQSIKDQEKQDKATQKAASKAIEKRLKDQAKNAKKLKSAADSLEKQKQTALSNAAKADKKAIAAQKKADQSLNTQRQTALQKIANDAKKLAAEQKAAADKLEAQRQTALAKIAANAEKQRQAQRDAVDTLQKQRVAALNRIAKDDAKAKKMQKAAADALEKQRQTALAQTAEGQRQAADMLQKQRVASLTRIARAEEQAENKRQRRLRGVRNRRRRRELQQQRSLPQDLAVFGQDLRQVGTGLFAAGAAGLAGFGVAVKNFAELDRVLRSIQGIAAVTDAEMSGLETTVRKLGATTSFTTQEVATAAQELARGGQSLANIQNTLPAVLNLARGTGSDLAFSAQSVVRTLGQFQLATTESTRVVDSLAAAANAGTLDLQDLGESMKFLGPIAETTGESVESVGAAFAVMANNGLRGGLAGRQLRRVFYELADPLKRLKILSELGVDTFDPSGNLRPIADLVSEIGASLNELPSGKKINFLDDIFGEGAAAFEALSKGRKEFRALIADIQVADGYAAKLAQGIDKGLYGQFLILISAISELGNTISEGLEPLLLPLLKYIQKVAQGAIEWASANKGTIATLATMSALAAGLGLALIGIGSSVAIIGAVASAVQVLSVALNAANISALALARGSFVGLAASIAVLAIAGEGMATYFSNWIDQIEEASLYSDDASQKVGQLAQALTDLNSVSLFDNAEDIEKFKNLVAGLEAQVGSLGAKFDKVTGKPINSDEVEQRAETAALIENNKRLEGEALKRLRDKEAELQAYEASFSGFYADSADVFGKGAKFKELSGEIDEARSKMEFFAKEQQRLRDGLKAEQAGIDLADALGVKFDPKDPVGTLLGPTSGAAFSSISAGVGKVFSFQLDKFGDDVIGPLAGLAEKYARDDLASGNANPLSAAVASIADVIDSSTTSGLSQSLSNSVKLFGETVGGTLGAAARFLAENLRVSEAEKAKEFEEALQQRASDLVGKFDLGGTSRQGAFGIEEAQRQVAGQTTNLLAQALKEEQQQKDLLKKIEEHLRKNPGLVGK